MRRSIIALLATAALTMPAFAASNAPASNPPNDQSQHPSGQQQQSQAQSQQNGAPNQPNQQASDRQQQTSEQHAARQSDQQTVSPKSLSRNDIRQMQTALNDDGFKAGRPDGKWGPHTRQAVRKFDRSKGIQSNNGQLTENTLAQLGVNANQQDQNHQGQSTQPPQNNPNGQSKQ